MKMKRTSVLLATAVFVLSCLHPVNADDQTLADKFLIVPGERIGCLALGGSSGWDKSIKDDLGEPNLADAAMGGQFSNVWILGKPLDQGKDFPAALEIGLYGRENREEKAPKEPSRTLIVWTTSPKYKTADGIGPGSTLDKIREKFPDLQSDPDMHTEDGTAEPKSWPLYGEMDFFVSKARRTAFAIQNKEKICVEVAIFATEPSHHPYQVPLAAEDPKMTPKTQM